jgi:hypothetical protein
MRGEQLQSRRVRAGLAIAFVPADHGAGSGRAGTTLNAGLQAAWLRERGWDRPRVPRYGIKPPEWIGEHLQCCRAAARTHCRHEVRTAYSGCKLDERVALMQWWADHLTVCRVPMIARLDLPHESRAGSSVAIGSDQSRRPAEASLLRVR